MEYHGFYQDTDFKWTYKSHNGIFIPVILNNKIQGLRIYLDNMYKLDTKNIWFSSNNLYNGTKANNWVMSLKDKNINWIDMYNCKDSKSIIIATEMILAHKIFHKTNKTVIGIPNGINKELILNIVKRLNASEVLLYMDKYTILHTSTLIYKNIIEALEEQNVKVNYKVILNGNDIDTAFMECEETKKIA